MPSQHRYSIPHTNPLPFHSHSSVHCLSQSHCMQAVTTITETISITMHWNRLYMWCLPDRQRGPLVEWALGTCRWGHRGPSLFPPPSPHPPSAPESHPESWEGGREGGREGRREGGRESKRKEERKEERYLSLFTFSGRYWKQPHTGVTMTTSSVKNTHKPLLTYAHTTTHTHTHPNTYTPKYIHTHRCCVHRSQVRESSHLRSLTKSMVETGSDSSLKTASWDTLMSLTIMVLALSGRLSWIAWCEWGQGWRGHAGLKYEWSQG